ncbi:MAG TPA: D-alanine--D-alanine ligase [Solirubrobacterales bacterium]|nr:D-alanine--D-alanine ligase [Solirubrobacterales bacterium]
MTVPEIHKVAVLKGGSSLERQVSLRSGARVADALRRRGYEVVEIDVGEHLVSQLTEAAPDVVFVALHGRGGEDGTVQELLDILGLPFTGCGVLASIRCMDKVLAKLMMQEAGIPTPRFVTFNETAFRSLGAADTLTTIEERFGFPLVVKPARGGSALGIKFAGSADEMPAALVSAFSYDDRVLIEQYIDGREIAVSLLDGEPLPAVEALPNEQHYFDFESRYEIGKTQYVCPAELDRDVEARVSELAVETFKLLGCHGFARVDFMLPKSGEPQVLEVNAIPGLTETSLMPQAADAVGIAFDELAERLLKTALTREPYALVG